MSQDRQSPESLYGLREYVTWLNGINDKWNQLVDGDMTVVDAKRSWVEKEVYRVIVWWGEEQSKEMTIFRILEFLRKGFL